jgi:hypothetical protein
MTAIDFPNSPTVGQLFTVGDVTWEWTGTVWQGLGTVGDTGPTGPAGATGAAGPGVVASATAPVDTSVVWYNTENGNAYLYYDSFWASMSGVPTLPTGGTTGQVLAKTGSTDYATQWVAPSGLEFIKSETIGTAVSSVTVTGAFSSTYDSYKVIVSGGVASGSTYLRVQLGTDTANHNSIHFFGSFTGTSPVQDVGANLGSFIWIGAADTTRVVANIEVDGPFLTRQTSVTSTGLKGGTAGGTGGTAGLFTGVQTSTTSFTSFRIFPNAGTLTGGTIAVYGYRKA